MKTLERISTLIKHTMVITLIMFGLQTFANDMNSLKYLYAPTDSTYMVASLSTQSRYTYMHPQIVNREVDATATYEFIEEDVQLEEWMLNAKNEFWNDLAVDLEDEMELEPWMMDAALW